MNDVRLILFGAAFTGITALSLGLLIVQALQLPLSRRESRLVGGLLGAAVLQLVVFLSLAMWFARPSAFLAIGVLSIGACLSKRAWRYGIDVPLDPLNRTWKWIFAVGMLIYGAYTMVHAMAPEISPDGASYHLGTVARWFRDGGFTWHTTNMYANLPMGVEMLFLYAFAFGRHSAAALVHWQFYLLMPFLLLTFGSRFGHAKAGAVAALLVAFSPVVGVDGASAYVDIATSAVVFGAVYLLLVWEQQRSTGLLVAIGILAGFAYACKMTAFAVVPLALVFVLWKTRSLRPALIVGVTAAVFISPWLIKNAAIVGNPFSPFLNRWFPNPYVKIAFEDEYRALLRDYSGTIKSPWEIPREVTVDGARLSGFLGPMFLLAPIALFALRWPLGRRVLLVAALFLATYPSNIGTRFLLTALPFVCFAMGLVLVQWRAAAAAAVLAHGVLSWPAVASVYSQEHAWRLDEFRWRAAFRLEKEEEFLLRKTIDYEWTRIIEGHVPPHGRVFLLSGIPEAYTSRDLIVGYQAGLNMVLADTLNSAAALHQHPSRLWTYRFPAKEIRRIRVVQTESSEDQWSIAEVRLFNGATELQRDAAWRIRSQPNPWEVQLAFDNSPMTRWRTWQPARPGMFVEIDLGRPLTFTEVRLETSPDQRTSARLEFETSPGQWQVAAKAPEVTERPPIEIARRIATDDLRRAGITHISVNISDYLAEDFLLKRPEWGLTLAAETRFYRLYRIH